jgi:hypothetical protein
MLSRDSATLTDRSHKNGDEDTEALIFHTHKEKTENPDLSGSGNTQCNKSNF